jgi:hypothetical protein
MDMMEVRSSMINLPEGDHDTVLLGEHREMVTFWTNVVAFNEQQILTNFALNKGRPMPESAGTIAYAAIARAAWSLVGVADIKQGDFDPVEFGKRCEAIAREQIARYRAVHEISGAAQRPLNGTHCSQQCVAP